MSENFDTLSHYRKRAAELKQIADGVGDRIVNNMIRQLARDYELLAGLEDAKEAQPPERLSSPARSR